MMQREFDEDFGAVETVRPSVSGVSDPTNGVMGLIASDRVRITSEPIQSIGEKIAAMFSRDKRHLTDAEQRCLGAMIDRLPTTIDPLEKYREMLAAIYRKESMLDHLQMVEGASLNLLCAWAADDACDYNRSRLEGKP